jgi:hypothetical protein
MPTKQIIREEWPDFFANFSRAHHGWLATIELLSPDLGAQTEARELPLQGVVAAVDDLDTISMVLGSTPDIHLIHTIDEPQGVWLSQYRDGERETLQIESAEGRTLVKLRPPVLPDVVTGMIIE